MGISRTNRVSGAQNDTQRDLEYMRELYIPNAELQDVWKWFILRHIFGGYDNSIAKALDSIQDSAVFAELLGDFLITKLSYYDLYKDNYHNLLLGMLSFRGFETISNRESGMGRYDLLVKMPKYYIIFELKMVKEEHLMESAVNDVLKQIDERKYWAGLGTNPPVYKVGIAFYNKQCVVKSVLHDGAKDRKFGARALNKF
ncbi:MAG: PD-(D/E)XK nuclease domain-containing protein [Clostridiales bacterium]|nr:PD-(D/E)XK nuclease domain-containing protein [Clostridiales bacterium]